MFKVWLTTHFFLAGVLTSLLVSRITHVQLTSQSIADMLWGGVMMLVAFKMSGD